MQGPDGVSKGKCAPYCGAQTELARVSESAPYCEAQTELARVSVELCKLTFLRWGKIFWGKF